MDRPPLTRPGEERLRQALRRFRRPPPPDALDVKPCTPFDVATDRRLTHLEDEFDRLYNRLNWLLTVIVGAALINIVISLLK